MSILIDVCSLIFFWSKVRHSSSSKEAIGLLRFMPACKGSGKRVNPCNAAAAAAELADVGSLMSPGNLWKGCGMPGSKMPGGKNGLGMPGGRPRKAAEDVTGGNGRIMPKGELKPGGRWLEDVGRLGAFETGSGGSADVGKTDSGGEEVDLGELPAVVAVGGAEEDVGSTRLSGD